MTPLARPILTSHLFSALDAKLIELLESLTPEDWQQQTLAPRWTVKDVAGHLLDTALRRLSIGRDRYKGNLPQVKSEADLVRLVNTMNREGVEFFSRMSPRLLTSLMKDAAEHLSEYFLHLDPFARAPLAVSWAGEQESLNWFDIAREFTERWHHQQQIRIAVKKPGAANRDLYYPVLDCFMRSLPHVYRTISAPEASCLTITVSGPSGGDWYLYKGSENWQLLEDAAGNEIAVTVIPEDIAWRIFTKGINKSKAEPLLRSRGNTALVMHVLNSLAIVG